MQWLTLVVWGLVALLALPLGRGALYGRASLGVQAVAGIGGLAFMVGVCSGGSPELAWWAVGCGGVGVLAMGVASAGLTGERAGVAVQMASLEEHEAGLAGAQLLLMGLGAILSMLVGLEIGLAS
jgi:hypothetical protein